MKYFIYITLGLILFSSCKKEEEETPVTSLEVRVLDQNGVKINEAVEVFLFTDLNSFNSSVTNEFASNFTQSATTSGGSVTFSNLDASTTYYVYIKYYKDFALNNYFSQYTIKNFLQVDKKTIVQIKLEPYKVANIGFYSLDNLNLNGDPIKIYFGDATNSIGTLTSIASGIPISIDDFGVIKVLYQNDGIYPWSATGANGCHWQGEVNITTPANGVGFEPIPLVGCDNGVFAFWSQSSNLSSSGGKIRVVLDNVDEVGSITSSRASAPNNCTDSGVLLINRPKGKYTYHAYSDNGTCSWQGTINITTSDCPAVGEEELKGCN